MATKTPVTVSGWYENTDGTVTHYGWRDGQLYSGSTVEGWADVPNRDYALDDAASRETDHFARLKALSDNALYSHEEVLDAVAEALEAGQITRAQSEHFDRLVEDAQEVV